MTTPVPPIPTIRIRRSWAPTRKRGGDRSGGRGDTGRAGCPDLDRWALDRPDTDRPDTDRPDADGADAGRPGLRTAPRPVRADFVRTVRKAGQSP
ncbi:hypothetical protein [Embleya sp. NPDC001921]